MIWVTEGPWPHDLFSHFLKREAVKFKTESGEEHVQVNRIDRLGDGYVALTGQQIGGRFCQVTYNCDQHNEKFRKGNLKFL